MFKLANFILYKYTEFQTYYFLAKYLEARECIKIFVDLVKVLSLKKIYINIEKENFILNTFIIKIQ